MARFKPSIGFDGFEGSMGNTTFVENWAGQKIAKAKITETTNVNSGGQVKQRGKLGFSSTLAALFVLVIVKVLNRKSVQTPKGPKAVYPRNLYIQQNIDRMFPLGTMDSFTPSNMQIGTQDLTNPSYNNVTIANDGAIDITFINNSGTGNASITDQIIVVLIDSAGNPHYYDVNQRNSGQRDLEPATAPAAGEGYAFIMAITDEEFLAANEDVETAWTTKYGLPNSQVLCLGNADIV